MREIVHIQAGQCGNQIGAKVLFYIHTYHSRFIPEVDISNVPPRHPLITNLAMRNTADVTSKSIAV
jgi:hypothetical protein